MSTDQIDEYEQGERVRKWLRDNGVSIIGGIGIGFAAILGFQAWQASKAGHREEAARQYGSFLQAQEGGNADQAAALAESLRANYADTAYPALAALRRAAALVEAGASLSIGLEGPIYVNQAAAFSDFHVTGVNPAGNATFVDPAFVAGRFRLVGIRRLARNEIRDRGEQG